MSGGGTARSAAERCAAVFRDAGHDPTLAAWNTGGPGAAELARLAAEGGADRLVAIGGDGTALDVAAGVLATSRPVAMAHLPCGTANVLALNLGIPRTLEGAIAAAVHGVEARMDVGLVKDSSTGAEEPFLLTVGTGLHADVIARADRQAKRRWGMAAYVWAGWSTLASPAPARYRVTVDGATDEMEATMVQVVNCGAFLRPGWTIGPGITPVDGRLDVLVYRARSRWEYARVAARFLQGAPTRTALVQHLWGERIRLETDARVGIQRDGEPAGTLPAEFSVHPRALPVVVPARSPLAA